MSETIKRLHAPIGRTESRTEKKVNEIIDWVNALCNMHDFDEHYHSESLMKDKIKLGEANGYDDNGNPIKYDLK